MRIIREIFLGLFLAVGISVCAYSQRLMSEQDFKAIFNEATKNYLFGKYVQSVNLYKECLRIDPQSSATHYQLSKVYLSAGNLALAREHAKKAVNFEGENKWFLQTLGDIYQMEQKPDSAVLNYEKMLAIDKDNINVMFGVASLYERIGNYSRALEYLNKIDSRIGTSKEVSMARYRIYESAGNSENAVKELKTVTALSPEDYMISGMIAEYYQRHGKPDSALFYYRKIFPEFRADPNVVFSYSGFLLESGKLDSAKALIINVMNDSTIDHNVKSGFFFNVLRDDDNFKYAEQIIDTITKAYIKGYEDDVRSLAVYSDVFLRLQKYDEATWALTEIANRDPSNYPVLEQLIYVLNIQGKFDKLINYAGRAKRIQPRKAVIYLIAGSAYYQNKEYLAALNELNEGLLLTEDNSFRIDFYSLMAECYQKISRYEESEKAFKSALAIDKNNLSIRNNFAYYLALREKDLSTAKRLSKATIKAEPENATYLDTYGWVMFTMGRIKAAEKFIAKAIANGSDKNGEVLAHYAEILIKKGEYASALKYLKRILLLEDKEEAAKAQQRIDELNILIK